MGEAGTESPAGERQGARTGEKIGVLGGTFDPIHLGHLAIARAAMDAHALDRVLLVPAARPPHKRVERTDVMDRLEMVRIAAGADRRLEASDIEARRGGVSYTVDTLASLARDLPGSQLFFIIGEDTIPELPLWKDAPRIFEIARIVAVHRPGPRHRFDPLGFPAVPPDVLARCERDRVEMPPSPIASREIRRAIAAGKPFEGLVPAGVAEYIRRHRLYGYRP